MVANRAHREEELNLCLELFFFSTALADDPVRESNDGLFKLWSLFNFEVRWLLAANFAWVQIASNCLDVVSDCGSSTRCSFLVSLDNQKINWPGPLGEMMIKETGQRLVFNSNVTFPTATLSPVSSLLAATVVDDSKQREVALPKMFSRIVWS